MSGPKPKDPEARRRRNATPGFRQLPPNGRQDPAPDFPLSGADGAEILKWRELWKLPQATEWERSESHDIVALYVRVWFLLQSNFDPKLLTELRQLDNKIGLSPRAMKELQWEIAEPEKEPEVKKLPDRPRVFIPDSRHLAAVE